MISQIYEQELSAAFEMLLNSVDSATEKAIQSQLDGITAEEAIVWNGIGVELQGKILYFKDLIIEHIKNTNEFRSPIADYQF